MQNYSLRQFSLLIILLSFHTILKAEEFEIAGRAKKVSIIYSRSAVKLDSLTAHLLAEDIQRVSGYLPPVLTDIKLAKGNVIIIGSIGSAWINLLKSKLPLSEIEGKWECYNLSLLNKPLKNIAQALVITGSDARGTAYGVFDLSERLGVNAWYWWADAMPQKKEQLSVNIKTYSSLTPSVKYRGIFINDEDWGLQPWAAETFEPETKDIGPKTYARVFELLLRLKANMIWPAMHPSTKAFFYYPQNKEVAAAYQIIIGSSHAEPMLRNNVSEWDKPKMGSFNYLTNSTKVDAYWQGRITESQHNDAIYTLGMRGVHDSGIEGVKTVEETVPLLERIIDNQRNMLQRTLGKKVTEIPQAFTAYKEVLDIYDYGLRIPDDVTLVWPDDNYGYIQRLNAKGENKRTGGSGVYYHASYWGRPHDYLWLGTTNPDLMQEEMTKAFQLNARNIWILNVGDIKPAEYQIQLFMDMAYQIDPFLLDGAQKTHLKQWVTKIYNLQSEHGLQLASRLTGLITANNLLSFERKPEYMGWSQTEPSTKVNMTAYNHFYYGDQAQRRIDAYTQLEQQVSELGKDIGTENRDRFYELVTYPLVNTALMNKKYLYRDKALLYAAQGRLIAKHYQYLSRQAHQNIVQNTRYYNDSLQNGKWRNMMNMSPRNLPVFQNPELDVQQATARSIWDIIPEGSGKDSIYFDQGFDIKKFTDIFLTADTVADYTVSLSDPWIKLSKTHGTLSAKAAGSQERIWISINWSEVPANRKALGTLTFRVAKSSHVVQLFSNPKFPVIPAGYHGFAEAGGYISMYAASYSKAIPEGKLSWQLRPGLGFTGRAMQVLPLQTNPDKVKSLTEAEIRKQPYMVYDFYTDSTSDAEVKIYTLPSFPLNKHFEMRYAVSIDGTVPIVVNFKTIGRSAEWKENVLSNSALRTVKVNGLTAGKHQLTIYSIDPGVIIDRIVIDLGGMAPFYGLLPETRL